MALTIVVVNDQAMGQERHNLIHKGMPTSYADYTCPDLVTMARAYGATGYRIDNAANLHLLSEALAHDSGVILIDIRINGYYPNPASRDIAHHLG